VEGVEEDGHALGLQLLEVSTASTEVHVLNGADGYQSMLLQTATVLGATGSDSRWVFDF
jgi:hypothetical protein